MVDNTNPTNQFHPYQPPDAIPQTGSESGLGGILKNVNVNDYVSKGRDYARKNPALVLGGIAAAVIGMGMMRGRR